MTVRAIALLSRCRSEPETGGALKVVCVYRERMARRGANAQHAHDQAIDELAERYQSEGWRVWADIDGWPTPPSVEGRRPDIVARDGDGQLIVEVETDRDADTTQHEKFRRAASDDPDAQFMGYVVDFEGEISSRFS